MQQLSILNDDSEKVVCKIYGEFDSETIREFTAFQKNLEPGITELYFDLSDVTKLTSAGVALLLLITEHLETYNTTVKVINYDDEAHRILTVAAPQLL